MEGNDRKRRRLESKAVGPLPIVNQFVGRLGLDDRIREAVEAATAVRGRKLQVSHGVVLGVVLRNLIVSRLPLYRFRDWVRGFVPELLGLTQEQAALINDDRIGNALDRFYEVDRASLCSWLVADMMRGFDLALDQIHNDTTTITFFGEYLSAQAGCSSPFVITHGFNKDHRNDLKQLVFSLCVTRDGAIPVQHKVFDGNKVDDNIHMETWDALRALIGTPDFIYIGDCKLCNLRNLRHIAGHGGRFITVMPKDRKEYGRFVAWIQTNEPTWEELIRRGNSRRKDGPDDVFRGFQDPIGSADGHRIIWIHSSNKARLDLESREAKIERACAALEALVPRIGRRNLRTRAAIDGRVEEILKATGAGKWLEVEILVHEKADFRQLKPGRPGKNTKYRRQLKEEFELTWKPRREAIRKAARMDGIFPLMDNVDSFDMGMVLGAYQFQPYIEKRHEQLKSVLEVAPVWLKSPTRIASFLTLMFMALLVSCLIEREARKAMKREGRASLPIYPEERECVKPTAEKILQLFDGFRRSRLFEGEALIDCFWDEMSAVQRSLLRLLSVPRKEYGAR